MPVWLFLMWWVAKVTKFSNSPCKRRPSLMHMIRNALKRSLDFPSENSILITSASGLDFQHYTESLSWFTYWEFLQLSQEPNCLSRLGHSLRVSRWVEGSAWEFCSASVPAPQELPCSEVAATPGQDRATNQARPPGLLSWVTGAVFTSPDTPGPLRL